MMRQPRARPARRPTLLLGAAILLGVVTFAFWRWQVARFERENAAREAPVRRLVNDAPLASLGLLSSSTLNPFRARGDTILTRINPIHPTRGLTRPAGPTIDACRAISGGVPAELILARGVPLPDPSTLGAYSGRWTGAVGKIKEIEFFTIGRLDVGLKDGAIVVVRVR